MLVSRGIADWVIAAAILFPGEASEGWRVGSRGIHSDDLADAL
jgi:hypothetical protein